MLRDSTESQNKIFIAVDVFMVGLLILNLLLISFDWFFGVTDLGPFLAEYAPAFHSFYESTIHEHFLRIDLVFVSIFLAEFVVSWVVAIARQTYYKWFFYPFVHWYDLVGCIPLSAFRIVRFLRVFTIIYRLHVLRVFPLEQTYLYRKAKKYYDIVLEEISDRVVENVINEMQAEVRQAGPTLDNIIEDVLRPKKDAIVEWSSKQLGSVAGHYLDNRRDEIREYVDQAITRAFEQNQEIGKIAQIPVAGKQLSAILDKSVSDIVYNVVEYLMDDLSSSRNRALVEEAAELAFSSVRKKHEDDPLHDMILNTLIEVLEIVKQQISYTKRWKSKDAEEKAAKQEIRPARQDA